MPLRFLPSRFTPKNLHQRPTVALLCGPHVQGAQGISCGRHLANHEVEVILFLPNFVKMLDSVTSELTLFNKTSGKQVSSIKGESLFHALDASRVLKRLKWDLTVPSGPYRSSRHPRGPNHKLPGLPREHIPDGSALVPSSCRLGEPEPGPRPQLGSSCLWPGTGSGGQVVPLPLPSPSPGGGSWPGLPVWHRGPSPRVPGSRNQVPFTLWLQVCYPSALCVVGLSSQIYNQGTVSVLLLLFQSLTVTHLTCQHVNVSFPSYFRTSEGIIYLSRQDVF